MNPQEIKKWINSNLFTNTGKIKSISNKHKLYIDNAHIFNTITNMVNINTVLTQKVKLYLQDIHEYPVCYCGEQIKKFTKCNGDVKFQTYCSNLCSTKSHIKIDKMVATKNKNNSFVAGGLKGHQTKLNDIDENGVNGAIRNGQKALQTKIKNGYVIPLEQRDDWFQYREKVYRQSNKIFHELYYQINPNNLTRGKEFHLDHIYSVSKGFENNIPVYILAHPTNLRILDAHLNITKRERCDITIDELVDKIL